MPPTPESELAALTRLIDELNESTGELADRSAEQTQVQAELRRDLADVKTALSNFVPKRRFRWVVAAVVTVILAALAMGLIFRNIDETEARRQRDQLAYDQEQDRQSLLRGCERANEHRSALRRVIERAYTPSPVPDGLSEELRELILQSQERLVALRAEQLADPGVQPINCAAQYPAPARVNA